MCSNGILKPIDKRTFLVWSSLSCIVTHVDYGAGFNVCSVGQDAHIIQFTHTTAIHIAMHRAVNDVDFGRLTIGFVCCKFIDGFITRLTACTIQVLQIQLARAFNIIHIDLNLALNHALGIAAAESSFMDSAAKEVEGDIAALTAQIDRRISMQVVINVLV